MFVDLREREKHQSVATVCAPTRDHTHSLGMYPEWDRPHKVLVHRMLLPPTEPAAPWPV